MDLIVVGNANGLKIYVETVDKTYMICLSRDQANKLTEIINQVSGSDAVAKLHRASYKPINEI